MESAAVNKTLIVTENDSDLTQAILFQAARYFSGNGSRVLYIAPEALSSLPMAVNDEQLPESEAMRLVNFLYLTTVDDLLFSLSTLISAHRPPGIIIIQDLENYVVDAKKAALVVAVVINTVAACSARLGQTAALLISCKQPVQPAIVRLFFHNTWCIHREGTGVTLKSLQSPIKFYTFRENENSIMLEKVFQESTKN